MLNSYFNLKYICAMFDQFVKIYMEWNYKHIEIKYLELLLQGLSVIEIYTIFIKNLSLEELVFKYYLSKLNRNEKTNSAHAHRLQQLLKSLLSFRVPCNFFNALHNFNLPLCIYTTAYVHIFPDPHHQAFISRNLVEDGKS